MIALETLIVAIVLVSFVQDSIEDRFLSVPVSEDQTSDGTFRNPLVVCQFLCRSKRNDRFRKEMSSNLCLRKCSRDERTGESFSSVGIKTKLKSPSMSRARRNTKTQEEDCVKRTPDSAVQVEASRITVDYEKRKPNLTIKWKPVYNAYYNWTSYVMFYFVSKTDKCVFIPKDQHEWILEDGDVWSYPDKIALAILTSPGHLNDFPLKFFAPDPPDPPTVPLPTKPGSTKVIIAILGVVAGLALLLVLVLVYRKRINLCSLFSRDSDRRADVLANPPRINNSCCADEDVELENICPNIKNNLHLSGTEFFYACYYPENSKFQLQVASVVNFFRENGYRVVMDVMTGNELVNLGPTRWAEQQIKKAHKILVFLSPGLLRLCGANDDDTQSYSQENERLWYELSLLRTIYSQTHSATRMVCITLPTRTVIDPQDLPLWAELRYRWPEDKRRILNRLNDRPIIQPW